VLKEPNSTINSSTISPIPAAMAVLLRSGEPGSGSGSSNGAQNVCDTPSPGVKWGQPGVGVGIGQQQFGVSETVVPWGNTVAVRAGVALPASQHKGTLQRNKHCCMVCDSQ
jgi:hypothetical protein